MQTIMKAAEGVSIEERVLINQLATSMVTLSQASHGHCLLKGHALVCHTCRRTALEAHSKSMWLDCNTRRPANRPPGLVASKHSALSCCVYGLAVSLPAQLAVGPQQCHLQCSATVHDCLAAKPDATLRETNWQAQASLRITAACPADAACVAAGMLARLQSVYK